MLEMRVGIMGAGAIAGVMADTLCKMARAEAYAVASRDFKKAECRIKYPFEKQDCPSYLLKAIEKIW